MRLWQLQNCCTIILCFMIPDPDSQLILQYQAGNEVALASLICRHKDELFSFILKKVRDEELANDLFQDTFVKIIITLKEGRYREEGKFIIWAKRVAYNLIIDHYRLKTKQQHISETTYENEDFSIFDLLKEPSESIEEILVKQQINEDLHKIIAYLPENQREVIKLRFFDGLSFKEIAEQTDASINTTLGRVRYALMNLRKIMKEHCVKLTK